MTCRQNGKAPPDNQQDAKVYKRHRTKRLRNKHMSITKKARKIAAHDV